MRQIRLVILYGINRMEATIYKIEAEDECYIGSTVRGMHCRKLDHLSNFRRGIKNCTSFTLFEKYGIDKCNWIELEKVPVAERYLKEREYIKNTVGTVNKMRPIVLPDEKQEIRKEYFQTYKGTNNYVKSYTQKYIKYKEALLKLVDCTCGKQYSRIHKQRHLRTAYHTQHTH